MTKTSKPSFILPFTGSWLTFWGGETIKQNVHYETDSQRYAFDFIQTDNNGKFFRTKGKANEDYFSFGQDILTPANGEVVEVVDGLRDNKPGELNSYIILGNYVMIKHAEGVFTVLGHFKQKSIIVTAGQTVKQGDKLGQCGNSGYSTDPHLHFHVQSSDVFAKVDKNYDKVNIAKGQKITFRKLKRIRDSKHEVLTDYFPIKGDVVSNFTS